MRPRLSPACENGPDLGSRYSYNEYKQWAFKEKVELADGFIHKINVVTAPGYSQISASFFSHLSHFFKPGQVFLSPFEVRLPDTPTPIRDEEVFSVVRPALCVITSPFQTDADGSTAIPDLIVEITGSSRPEMEYKFRLYETKGVKEYWVAVPGENRVYVHTLEGGRYRSLPPFRQEEVLQSPAFPGLEIPLREIFRPPGDIIAVGEPAIAYAPDITSLDLLDFSKIYSYADYLRWKFQERVELIRGYISKMCPAPTFVHQKTALRLVRQLDPYFARKHCEMLFAPFDVRLHPLETRDHALFTVVQPDICVICNASAIDERGAVGVPDLIVEILSPGNPRHDTAVKYALYEENRVKEYWIADPASATVCIHTLSGNKYAPAKFFSGQDEVHSELFPDLRFSLREVFPGPGVL